MVTPRVRDVRERTGPEQNQVGATAAPDDTDIRSREIGQVEEEAIEWAKRCPGSPNETIEVRQVQELTDFPADIQAEAAGLEALRQK